VEAFARGDDLVVRAELPGIDPEKDVDITLEQGVLTIRGERRQEEQDRGEQYFRSERRYGAFQRQLVLPEGTNAEDITASYKDGILEVVVPKAARDRQARKIPVSMGGKGKAVLTEGRKE
jgi:HSP20 family protein